MQVNWGLVRDNSARTEEVRVEIMRRLLGDKALTVRRAFKLSSEAMAKRGAAFPQYQLFAQVRLRA